MASLCTYHGRGHEEIIAKAGASQNEATEIYCRFEAGMVDPGWQNLETGITEGGTIWKRPTEHPLRFRSKEQLLCQAIHLASLGDSVPPID
jgi:hypothetical protein